MACECIDTNGSLLESCLGVCSFAKMEQRALESVNYFNDHAINMLKELRRNLNQIQSEVKEYLENSYLDGFRKGFEMAKDIYE